MNLNMLERSAWTGIQTGIGILTANGLGWLEAEAWAMAATALVASLLSALKTLARDRLAVLENGKP